jgi:urease accessory protein
MRDKQKNKVTPHLGMMLHLCDPTLPIGGFSHSSGLETYIQLKIVHDEATTEAFVKNMIENNLLYNDAAFVKLAYQASQSNALTEIIALDQECSALKAPMEIREATKKLGSRFLKIFDRQVESGLIEEYKRALSLKNTEGNYPIVYGLFAQTFGVPLQDALYAYGYNAAIGMITNAVKMVPLGQLVGQDILFRMQGVIQNAVAQTMQLERELVGVCNIGFDIRCMQHEKLYSRLYMS